MSGLYGACLVGFSGFGGCRIGMPLLIGHGYWFGGGCNSVGIRVSGWHGGGLGAVVLKCRNGAENDPIEVESWEGVGIGLSVSHVARGSVKSSYMAVTRLSLTEISTFSKNISFIIA